jgi:hypothetical protein
MIELFPNVQSDCVFSEDRAYRYWLRRTWDADLQSIAFLMLNPSTADEQKNDPTVERCQRRAKTLGYGSFVVVNLFALRSTDPAALYSHPSPVSEAKHKRRNDDAILRAQWQCEALVCAWGAHGKFAKRAAEVLDLFSEGDRREFLCLGKTKDGHPRHPLYVPYSQSLVPF